jgi:cytochrome P450
MLDAIERRGNAFDGMEDYGAQLVVGALLTAMINLDERRKAVFLAFHEVLPLTTYTKPGDPFPPECVRAYDDAAELVNEIIAERRANPGPDIISALIQARDHHDKLTDRELFDQVFTLCGAALSTTSRAAGGALSTPIRSNSANSSAGPTLFRKRSRSACASPATGISPSPGWRRATPRSAAQKY